MTLAFDKLELPFAKGLNQKADPRLVQEPELVRAVDVEFDDIGGLRVRYPYASIGANIFGGGSISDCRRIYAVGSELILFTSTAMYSWSSQRSAWVLKGTHLAVKVEEETVFARTSDQVDTDRAQLSGTVAYCWSEVVTGVSEIFVAAQDSSSGAVLLVPTDVAPGTHPRIVALETTIVLFYESGTGALVARTINPSTLAISGATTVLAAASFNVYYDVETAPGSDSCLVVARRDTTTAYSMIAVSSSLGLLAGTQPYTCDGPIAVAMSPDGETFLVVRANGTAIEAELFDSGLSVTYDNRAIGSGTLPINQVTAVWVDNTTAHVFWHSNEEDSPAVNWTAAHNTVNGTSGAVGTAASFIGQVGVASRAFAYGGNAYVWMAFAGVSSSTGSTVGYVERAQLQNSLFLYRHDAFLVAKAAWQRAAGFRTTGLLPGVALTSGSTTFSCGVGERRIIPLGENHSGYSDQGPRDITITFDSNDARRVAKLGETIYITGGEVLQYDGTRLVECGFHIYPWFVGLNPVGGAGTLDAGVYTLKDTWRYDNARGERERSTVATTSEVTIGAAPNGIEITVWVPLQITHKSGIAVELWRTAHDSGAPFFLATSTNPTQLTGDNPYVVNNPASYTLPVTYDRMVDSTLTTREPNPENDSVLENLAPPAATLIAANDTRLFLAGIAGAPHSIVYSKQRNVGEVAAFHDALAVSIPDAGGNITALAFLNETLIVFRETAVYVVEGAGLSNTATGENYTVRLVSNDVGAVSQEAVALVPAGLAFKSRKGWCLVNRSIQVDTRLGAGYIGAAVSDYDSETVHAVHVVESQHQMRVVTSGRVLVWDYLVDAWAEWSISDGLHAAVWNGAHHVLATAAVRAQQASHATTTHGCDIEMLVHVGQLQGLARVRRILELGEYRSPHTQRWRIGGYEEGVYHQDKTWTPSGYTAGDELEEQLGLVRQQVKVIRVRITTSPLVDTTGEQLRLTALSFDVGIKPGVFPNLPAARRH